MQKQDELEKINPNIDEYKELDIHDTTKWYKLLMQFRGCDLAIIAIVIIVLLTLNKLAAATMLSIIWGDYIIGLGEPI